MSTVKRIETRQIKQFQRKRVAAYARVSVDTEQLMHSLSAQVSYYSNLIQGTPEWEYVGVYIDAGITGTDTKPRERFQEMIADCEAGKIDIILTKSISRFARNTVDLLATVRHLKELGVEVRFEREHVNTFTSDGEVMLSILASFAEQESISLSQNIKWRVRKNYEQGKPHAHLKLYGYRWKGDERVIEPDEAEAVRFIFAEYLSGKSFREIATELDEKEIRSVRGTEHFSPQTIRKMISNEEYTGCQIYQQVYAYKPHKQRINYGEKTVAFQLFTDFFSRARMEVFASRESVAFVFLLAGPALIRGIHRKQSFHLITVCHIQCGGCPQNPGQIAAFHRPGIYFSSHFF